MCTLTIQPGKACKMPLTGSDGTCLGDGTCQTPCKAGDPCMGACGMGTCDATGHCLTPASLGKACSFSDSQKLCVTSCTCNVKGGIDIVPLPDGAPMKIPLKCYPGAVCMAGHAILPKQNDSACDDGTPCTTDLCCPGWGAGCSQGNWNGSAWEPSFDCYHFISGQKCGNSGCFVGMCSDTPNGWPIGPQFCKTWVGEVTVCENDCDTKCHPTDPCQVCTAAYGVDGCPCTCKPGNDGGFCGDNLICKSGQCVLK